MSATVLWAGKPLSLAEEQALRRLVALLGRNRATGTAESFARFLPEHAERWSPDELQLGAQAGPWLSFEAELA